MSYPSNDMKHIVLTPKWRKPKFQSLTLVRAAEGLIAHICQLHRVEILKLAIQPDHVHLAVLLPLDYYHGVPYYVQQIKWFSSIHLRRMFPELKQDRYFWGKHYGIRSIGGGRAAQLKYIADQIR